MEMHGNEEGSVFSGDVSNNNMEAMAHEKTSVSFCVVVLKDFNVSVIAGPLQRIFMKP